MNNEKFYKLITSCESKQLNEKSIIILKDEFYEEGYLRWGWNDDVKEIREHVLYTFIIPNMANINDINKTEEISNKVLDLVLNNKKIKKENLSSNDQEFVNHFNKVLKSNTYFELKISLYNMFTYINNLNYKINCALFATPKEALPKALEIDKLTLSDEFSFSNVLKDVCGE